MQRIDVGGHALRADVRGAGPPDVVCLHGLVDSLEIWDRLMDPLAARGRVVRIDQRGHGEADAPPGPYDRADLAADVVAVLDHLAIGRAILLAHSMGGVVALTMALLHPARVAALVLLGTTSACSARVARWYAAIADAGEAEGTAGLARRIYGSGRARAITGNAQGIAHVTRTLGTLHDDPLTPRLGAVTCPALVLVGADDPMGPKASAVIAEHLPDATFEVVPGCGHWMHVERPTALLDTYDRWAATHLGGADTRRNA